MEEILTLGPLKIDFPAKQLFKHEQLIILPELSFDVLAVLLKNSPEPVSKAELFDKVWGTQVVSDETLKVRISLLRKALGDEGQYISSVRNKGYKITLPYLPSTVNNTPDVITPPPEAAQVQQKPGLIGSKYSVIAGGILAGSIILSMALMQPSKNGRTPPLPDTAIGEASRGSKAESLYREGISLLEHQPPQSALVAIGRFNDAITLNNHKGDYYLALGEAHIQAARYGHNYLEHLASAKSALAQALTLSAPEIDSHLLQAKISLCQGHYAQALFYMDSALSIEPGALKVQTLKITSLLDLGRMPEAKALLDELLLTIKHRQNISVGLQSSIQFLLASYHLKLGNYQQASEYTHSGLQLSPQNQAGAGLKMAVLYLTGEYRNAFNYYRRLEGLSQQEPEMLSYAALSSIMLNDFDQAMALLNTITASAPGWRYSYQAQLLHAFILTEQGEDDAAGSLVAAVQTSLNTKEAGNESSLIPYYQAQIHLLQQNLPAVTPALNNAIAKGLSNIDRLKHLPAFRSWAGRDAFVTALAKHQPKAQ